MLWGGVVGKGWFYFRPPPLNSMYNRHWAAVSYACVSSETSFSILSDVADASRYIDP